MIRPASSRRRPRPSRRIGLAAAASSLLVAASTAAFRLPPSRPDAFFRRGLSPAHPAPTRPAARTIIRPAPRGAPMAVQALPSPAVGFLSSIGSPLGSVGILAFVILVHEAGHFGAARYFGMAVDEFSVGVGPRIAGVRRRPAGDGFVFERIDDGEEEEDASEDGVGTVEREEGSIEFSLRALPLGGYVKFPEHYNRTLAFEREDAAREARDEARRMRVEGASAIEKGLEALAARSFAFNVLTLGLLKVWQSRREEEQLRRAEEAARSSSKSGGKNGSWWSAMPWAGKGKGEDGSEGSTLDVLRAAKVPEVEYFDDPNLLQNRPWQQRAVVLSGGVVFNVILAFACYFGELTAGKGLPTPVFDAGAVVSRMPGTDSPSYGLLKQGDVILGVNDRITSANSATGVWASQREISDIISTIRGTAEGEDVKLTIAHGKSGGGTEVVAVSPKTNDAGVRSIGVMLGPNYARTDVVRASSVFDAASKAGSAVYDLTAQTARSTVGLLSGLVLKGGLPAGTSLSGPIGVVKSGAEVVSKSDLSAVVAFAATISINLAVVNALPLPALDGGQLALLLGEAAAGRRIDQRVQEGINAGALLLLFCLSVGTTVGDVTSFFR